MEVSAGSRIWVRRVPHFLFLLAHLPTSGVTSSFDGRIRDASALRERNSQCRSRFDHTTIVGGELQLEPLIA